MKAYTQLTQEQRYQIHAFMKTELTQKTIAEETRGRTNPPLEETGKHHGPTQLWPHKMFFPIGFSTHSPVGFIR